MLEQLMERSERWMYATGRPNRVAGCMNAAWARAARVGILGGRLVSLEVAGRASGRMRSCPLIVVRQGSERYLVSMLGEDADWVHNVRAARGKAALRHGGREQIVLEEVDPRARAPILKRHLEVAPAARSFTPVDRNAGVEEFERIAHRFPVFRVRALAVEAPSRTESSEPKETRVVDIAGSRAPRMRRWRRILIAAAVVLVVLVVLVVGGIGVYLKTSAVPALALPSTVSPPARSLDGQWNASTGSVAGFRIVQTVLGMTGDVVGRTNAVTGSAVVADGAVTSGDFRVDMTSITSDGKPSPQFDQTLQTQAYPEATFTFTQPLALNARFVAGDAMTTTATGNFTLHGVTRAATVQISARRDGSAIDVTGSIPLTFSDWGIRTPDGFGWLGSLADRGQAEFLLVLRHA